MWQRVLAMVVLHLGVAHSWEAFINDNPTYKAICMYETWLSRDRFDTLQFPGCKTAASFCRRFRNGGGVCIILKDDIECIECCDIRDMTVEYCIEVCAYIAVGVGDQLIFYNYDGTKTDTVHFPSQHLAALAYDEVHNMMLYVDKQSDNDAICGYILSSMEYKYLIERKGRNIQGLAYDPATEKLFFTDTKEKSINWISLKPGFKNNVYGNLLLKIDDGIPTDIAVDNCRGYIYWINTNLSIPTIERARFNGSEREVVINSSSLSINTTYKQEPHSLVFDQQTQKMFWVEPETGSRYNTYTADFNGKNKDQISYFTLRSSDKVMTNISNVLTVTKETLISWVWCANCPMWEEAKIKNGVKSTKKLFHLQTDIPVGITAKYTIKQQTQGLQDCETLKSLVRDNSTIYASTKIASEYDGPFCVHGMKVNGQSRCKCTLGYTGERCDVSICLNYCLHGNCSFNDEGLPKCSCKAGYSGDRCEVSECHGYCSNNGDCSLNENSEPICQCKGDYSGDKCEVSACQNYCMQGNCSFNDEGLPKCSCIAGYSGDRCEVFECYGYCSNNGDCSLNENSEPVCQCKGDYSGDRCEVLACQNYCMQGSCSFNNKGHPTCSCNAGYSGERCEVYACYGYCLNDGVCSLNEEDALVCQCDDKHEGSRCEVVKNNTFTFTSTPTYSAQKNLTLADLLSNWRKPTAKISITVEV